MFNNCFKHLQTFELYGANPHFKSKCKCSMKISCSIFQVFHHSIMQTNDKNNPYQQFPKV